MLLFDAIRMGYSYDVIEIVFKVYLCIPVVWQIFLFLEINDFIKSQVGYSIIVFS